MSRPRILLADDHAILREGLVRLLEARFEVLGAVADGRALMSEVERLRPDAVVLDVGMPLLNGIEAATRIAESPSAPKIVFLTQHAGKEYVQAAFRIGASGYVLKNAASAELEAALTEVLAGRRFLSSELRERFGDPDVLRSGASGVLGAKLTPRQREVLQLVAEGKSAKEIANVLNISVKTVEFHKASIMDELGVRTTAELTRYAVESGMVPPAPHPLNSAQ
jgi:DNA-binding NarL/FixJ family response regulator